MTTYRQSRISAHPVHCRGYSIIELMVALVITLILIAGVGQIFLSSKKSFTIQNALGRQQENGRYVVDAIVQDLRRAGYLGGALRAEETAGSLPVATGVDTCAADTSWGRMLETPVFGLDDTATGYNCITNYLQGDIIVTRYGAAWAVGSLTTPTVTNTKLYLQSDPTSPYTARIYLGSALPAKLPVERDSELIARAYYVRNSGRTCSYKGINQPIPALFRVELDNSGLPGTPQEIADGVEQLQVQYGVDDDGDLAVDRYYDADNVADWGEVIAARLWVLTRAECPETGYTNNRTYTMGDQDYNVNDNYRRQLYQTTVKLRNRLGAT